MRLALLAVAALAAAPAVKTAPAPAAVKVISIAGMAYGKAPAGLKVGDVIEWRNDDILRHTVTAADLAFDLDLKPGERARVTLKKPGVVAVFCRYHPSMTLRFNVAPAKA